MATISPNKEKISAYDLLKIFVIGEIRRLYIYQPVMIMGLLEKSGSIKAKAIRRVRRRIDAYTLAEYRKL